MAKNMTRRAFPRGGISTRLPLTIYRRSSADEFSPTEISGLYAWWDATDSSTYTVATGVSSCRDKVATRAATQSTGSLQPLLSTINGRTAFVFDQGDLLLASGLSYSITAQSTFAVCQIDTATSGFGRIIAQESEAENANYIALLIPNPALFQVGSYFSGAFRSGVSVTQSTGVIAESHHNGTSLSCVANGVSGSSFTGALSFSPTKIAMGNSASAGASFIGRIGEVLIWNRAMLATEISAVRRHLSRKWGIAA
jgi:hypothetical protein